MKKILGIVIVITSLFISGCGKKPVLISQPKVGQTNIANVGNSMYAYYYGSFNRRAMFVNNRYNVQYGINTNGVRLDPYKGHQCVMHMRDNSLFDYNCDGYVTHDINGNIIKVPLKYKIFPHPGEVKKAMFLSHSILYQGRVGNKIKVSYREFFNDFARPSFTQEIEYQLNGSGQAMIGFKGIKIKVLRATNMSIKYKIIQEYN